MAGSQLPAAALLCRHGERTDGGDTAPAAERAVWLQGPGKERPWDPELTPKGFEQARLLGRRLREGCGPGGELGCAKPTRIYCSPYKRTVQTAVEVAKELGITEILIEAGLVECMIRGWFYLWAVPIGVRKGDPVAEGDLRPEALAPTERCWPSAEEIHKTISSLVNPNHKSCFSFAGSPIRWGCWENPAMMAERGTATVKQRMLDHPAESAVFVGHGGPLMHTANTLIGKETDWSALGGYTSIYALHSEVHGDDDVTFKAHPSVYGCNAHLRIPAKV